MTSEDLKPLTTDQVVEVRYVAHAIADGFSNGNEPYDAATDEVRERYDMAAEAVVRDAQARLSSTPRAGDQANLPTYDAGLLSDYGGGNVDWWQDYIRAELGRAHDFYAALSSTGAEDGWRPIETAPKDGTAIIMFEPGGAARWFIGEGRWVDDGGWWRTNNDPTDHWGDEIYPTHWRPLPPPPALNKEAQP